MAAGTAADLAVRRCPERRSCAEWSGGERRNLLGDGRLAVGRLVLVDDALAHGLVELARGVAHQGGGRSGVAGLARLVELADHGLQRRLDRLVTQPGLLVLPVALDLRLDVRHATAFVLTRCS